MKKKTVVAGIAAFTLVALLVPQTFAAQNQNNNGLMNKGLGRGGEDRVAIEQALEEGDYAAWKELVPERLADKIDETEFQDLVAEREERETHREAVDAAIESGDYTEWKTLVTEQNAEAPILEKITESNFSKFSELHKLREQVRTLETELDLAGPGMGMGGGKMGGSRGEKMGGGRGLWNLD
jgi:hypothetical protein